MRALIASLRLNSLYSITMPFTWQSALTYPILPPSAVIGLLANALQRYRDDNHPLEYLDRLESDIIWAGSRLLSPCVIRSYTMSAITKWQDLIGGKFTNALGRQFAFTRRLQIAAVFQEGRYLEDLVRALQTTPLTCGDSESPATVEAAPRIADVTEFSAQLVTTRFAAPYSSQTRIEAGNGEVLLMHPRCKKTGRDFNLVSFIVPLRQERQIIYPDELTIRLTSEKALMIEAEDTGAVITYP
ncbi:MAG: CRISPR-associated protein Cas5 [candidate division WOR-3 bacterium]